MHSENFKKIIKTLNFPPEDLIIFSKFHPDFLCPQAETSQISLLPTSSIFLLLCIYFQLPFPLSSVIRTSDNNGASSVYRMVVSFCRQRQVAGHQRAGMFSPLEEDDTGYIIADTPYLDTAG